MDRWQGAGKSIKGPHKGKELETVTYGDYFAFALLVFRPDTNLYGVE